MVCIAIIRAPPVLRVCFIVYVKQKFDIKYVISFLRAEMFVGKSEKFKKHAVNYFFLIEVCSILKLKKQLIIIKYR